MKCLQIKKQAEIPSPEEVGDRLVYLKKTSEMLDDARKELNKIADVQAQILCNQWVHRGDGEPIRGAVSTTYSPRVNTKLVPPKEGTPEYAAIIEKYGFQVTKLSWSKLSNIVGTLDKKGEPLPECLKNLTKITKCSITSRSKV